MAQKNKGRDICDKQDVSAPIFMVIKGVRVEINLKSQLLLNHSLRKVKVAAVIMS